MRHVKPLSIGLNCSLLPRPDVSVSGGTLGERDVAISCYPNAGLPNPLSETGFDLGPADMARYLGDFARGGLINIAGGCCGNTPEHIAAIAKALNGQPPREMADAADRGTLRSPGRGSAKPDRGPRVSESNLSESEKTSAAKPTKAKPLRLSGSQPFTQQAGVFIMIGERTNVAGSPKFARLIKDGKYEDAVNVARQQVENGANVLDICMDEGMIDGVTAMTRFLQLLGSEPEVARAPSWWTPQNGRSLKRA